MQATFLRMLIMPLQIGHAVHLNHHFASRYLIDTLYQLGFCKSYKEVQNFEKFERISNLDIVKEVDIFKDTILSIFSNYCPSKAIVFK